MSEQQHIYLKIFTDQRHALVFIKNKLKGGTKL